MKRLSRRARLIALVVTWASISTACDSVPGVSNLLGDGDADLIPVPAAGFCEPGGVVRVTVRNQGASDAKASTTRIRFTQGGTFDLTTPDVGSGRIAILSQLGIPPACFQPDCVFEVTVDANANVTETDEGNNSAEVRCPPPS